MANPRDDQGDIKGKMFFFLSSIHRFPNVLKNLARIHIKPIMKWLAFIFSDVNRTHFAQIWEGLLKLPCIVISVVCSICSGPILNQGKQGRNRRKIREISGKMTSLNWQTLYAFVNK